MGSLPLPCRCSLALLKSQWVVVKVPVKLLICFVPEHDHQVPGNHLDSGNRQLHYIVKRPTELIEKRNTYFLPIGSLSGFRSTLLNLAKKSSHGTAS